MEQETNVQDTAPNEKKDVEKTLREFLTRLENIHQEIAGLKEAEKDLWTEFSDRLDAKTLKAALRVLKIEASVDHKNTFDTFYEVLKSDYVNGLTND